MVLNIGSDLLIFKKDIVAIFDSQTMLSSKKNRYYLNSLKDKGKISGWDKKTASFVLTQKKGVEHVYCSTISRATLLKRMLHS